LLWSRSRSVELHHVRQARFYEPKVKTENARSHAVEVVFRGGSFVVPADSKAEVQWLIAEINDFVSGLAA
jgi:hypothetical protein